MDKILNLYKRIGETPLECLERFREGNIEYGKVPMTYAGRLDPLAEGVLLVLAGTKTKEKEMFLKLSKTYECKILFGFSTDSYDVLGKAIKKSSRSVDSDEAKSVALKFVGKSKQKYPVYSSKTVKGKPLFIWERRGLIHEINIPSKIVVVHKISNIGFEIISTGRLLKFIESRVSKVRGDFRQNKIVRLWRKNLGNSRRKSYAVMSLTISCGSGFYVRSFANDLGLLLNLPTCLLSLRRTRVGGYSFSHSR